MRRAVILFLKSPPTWREDAHPRDRLGRFAQKKDSLVMPPDRLPWGEFPDVLIHADEQWVKQHQDYAAAKAGDDEAAQRLVAQALSDAALGAIRQRLAGRAAYLVPIHAIESAGINQIPAAMAKLMGRKLDLPVWSEIVQVNKVGHTGAGGYHRMAHQPLFDGDVIPEANHVLVDDFIGMGGTVANLRGHIHRRGGRVLLATALTGRPYSAMLTPSAETLSALRRKHGTELEHWWQDTFGHGFDSLTQSEARYLERSPDADTIRDRLLAAGS